MAPIWLIGVSLQTQASFFFRPDGRLAAWSASPPFTALVERAAWPYQHKLDQRAEDQR